MAGAHEMILRLPKGYETPIGAGGHTLSGGQRQQVALARALFDTPVVVVLDEPDTNLDEEGSLALARALLALKQVGTTVVLISHRPNILGLADRILVLSGGTMQAFGTRQEIMARLAPQPASPAQVEHRGTPPS
jgi:ABC-type protease/lipase transport system fused ATPase/permease subunit